MSVSINTDSLGLQAGEYTALLVTDHSYFLHCCLICQVPIYTAE